MCKKVYYILLYYSEIFNNILIERVPINRKNITITLKMLL